MIDIIINLLFGHNPGLRITKTELNKLFELAISVKHFLFEGTLYDQTDAFANSALQFLFWLIFSYIIIKFCGKRQFKK